jgi:hypothetical protein
MNQTMKMVKKMWINEVEDIQSRQIRKDAHDRLKLEKVAMGLARPTVTVIWKMTSKRLLLLCLIYDFYVAHLHAECASVLLSE